MKPVAASGGQYHVPAEPNRWPAIALAAAVHAGLLAFLYIGISWQNTAPVAVEAEVWDMKTQAAAPPPPPPPEAVEPEPAPIPKVAEPPPQVEQPVAPKPPDIALEREKRKEEKRKLLEEQKREDEKLAKQQKLAEKKAQELADKKAEEAEKKLEEKKLEEKKLAEKAKADKAAKAKLAADETKKLAKARDDEMRRITGSGTSGEAEKSTAPRIDTGYLASITSKIKSTTSYPGSTDVPGNPKAVFKVEELPTGEIISVKLVKSSGIPAFDDSVEKGIIKASPLPKKKNGTVERTLEIAFSMKDLN
jgi:colicin import membrane protein